MQAFTRDRMEWGEPCFLFKAFKEFEHARSFIEDGCIRMRPVEHYREIEDIARRDVSEGEFSSVDVNNVVRTTIQANPKYIFCMAGPGVDLPHIQKFGDFVVRINDPYQFALDLRMAVFASSIGSEIFSVDFIQVIYDPPEKALTLEERDRLSYTSKPGNFAYENEFRVAIVCGCMSRKVCPGEYIDIQLGNRPSYLELIQPTGGLVP